MFVRRLAIVTLALLAALWAVPSAWAQAAENSADSGGATVESATPETMESLEEKPAAKVPKRQPKPEPVVEETYEGPDMSLLVPQDEVQQRRQAALTTERVAQEEVELAKPSVKRSKVVRLDNQPKQKTRPIAIIKGSLGPWGYGQRYREGTAGTQKQNQNQNPQAAQLGRGNQQDLSQGLSLGGNRGRGRGRRD
ncbi:MAG: hypothetical protein K1Y02_02840 [Candidatus Hydrogenedentes bacterium]|nr:hypothetical protein [Candidatus Hydrogenedentota bacterium]